MRSDNAKEAPPGDRKERRRKETRRRLLDAAQRVMGRKGIAATTISDITEEADVGLGTFYHHFDSKEVLLAPMLTDLAERIGSAIDAASQSIKDPAEVISIAVRYLVSHADDDASLGWFVVRSAALPEVPDAFLRRNMRDLLRGIESGRFRIADAPTAQAAICGAVTSVMLARLTGKAPANASELLAEMVLRSLGIADDEAANIARRPLPARLDRSERDPTQNQTAR